MQEGWLCPRCGKVNAPWVQSCSCQNATTTIIYPDITLPLTYLSTGDPLPLGGFTICKS